MAIEGFLSTHCILHQSALIKNPAFGLVMLRKTRFPVKKTVAFQIRSSIRDQIFEDSSNGIICYKDNNGEIVCEGFDEGPRLIHQSSSKPYSLREESIFDHLPQRWLYILDGETANGEARTCNGFNALH